MTFIESLDRQNDQDQLDFPITNVLLVFYDVVYFDCFLSIGTKFLTIWLWTAEAEAEATPIAPARHPC